MSNLALLWSIFIGVAIAKFIINRRIRKQERKDTNTK